MNTEHNEPTATSTENTDESQAQENVNDSSEENITENATDAQPELVDYEAKMAELNDKYLRLYSEFDNIHLLNSSTYNHQPQYILTISKGELVKAQNFPDFLKSYLPVISNLVFKQVD